MTHESDDDPEIFPTSFKLGQPSSSGRGKEVMMNRNVALIALSALISLILGCQEKATLTDPEVTPAFAVERIDVCHNLGTEGFELISIAPSALESHLRHGDAQPGQPVPGMEGHVFDDLCEPQAASLSLCPCFDDADLDDIDWASQSCVEFQNNPGTWVGLAYQGGFFGTTTVQAYSFSAAAECGLSIPGVTFTDLTPEEISACEVVLTEKALDLGFSEGIEWSHLDPDGVTEGSCPGFGF